MPEVRVINGKAYCKKCGKEVAVKEEPGEQGQIGQMPHVLQDDQGHVIAERSTKDEPWQEAA